MRTATLLLALSALVFGDDAPKERTLKDGKLTDPYWGLTYVAPSLEQGMFGPSGQKLFEGRAAGGVEIEILVQEADKEKPAAEWMAEAKKTWAEKRKMQDVEEKDATILFMEESLAGFKRHHGYAFHARGLQAFIVHASVNEKSETSGDAIRAALGGLTLDPDATPALLVYMIAKQQAYAVDDPKLLLGVGNLYLYGNEQQHVARNVAMAERVLGSAIRLSKADTYGPDELWALHENMGLATLERRELDAAIGWLLKSEQLSEKATGAAQGAKTGQSAYNLACAYALAGKLDEAFGALDRCAAKGFMGNAENLAHMKEDTDLDNLKKDPRWEKYWKPAEGK